MHTCYAPVRRSPAKCYHFPLPLDLHVLSLSLAFILSQDQTLHDKKILLCLLSRSRFNSCPATSLDARGNARFFVTSIFLRTRLSLFDAPPFFRGESGRKDNTFLYFPPNLFHHFFKLFFAPSLHPSSPGVNRHPLRESGCKDKATFIAFPNIQGTFFQEKINSRRISVRLNNLRGSGLVTR